MLAATHMLGGAVGYKLTRRFKWIGLSLAFASHFALDRIHHFDLNISWNLVFGLPVILFLCILGWRNKDIFLIVAGFLGALPDILSILHISNAFNQFHMFLHFKPSYPLPHYLLGAEAVIVALFMIILMKKKRKRPV